jgi:hypothetical protein
MRKLILCEPLVVGIARLGRPVGAEFGRKISFGVFAGQRASARKTFCAKRETASAPLRTFVNPGLSERLSQPPSIKIRY